MFRRPMMFTLCSALLVPAGRVVAQSAAPMSAAISQVRYDLTFDSASAARHTIRIAMTFDVTGALPVLLSIPTWTPGAYDVSNFARKVSHFEATMNGEPRRWDKLDPDTWRVRTGGPGTATVTFDFLADTLDNAMAWARPDFLMVNGTNVFPYAEGRTLQFPATVTVHTEPGWQVTTGMHPAGAPLTYRERNYHDLVDMPFFIGRFDLDSTQISDKWVRLATYPVGAHGGEARAQLWRDFARILPAHGRVFDATPWDNYTQFIVYTEFGGISALEHQSSNVAISAPQLIGTPVLSNVLAHEMFHAWNVKRLRPSAMVPYGYAAWQPTTLLWVSEGFTDYYADLGEVRGGVIDSVEFLQNTYGHMDVVANTPPASVEDASLQIWIHPEDGTDYIYYDKGSVIGLLLDILIRDASNNHHALDDVMRELYRTTYLQGRGFTNEQFWAAVGRAAGRPLTAFYTAYVDGREDLPYDSVLPLAGLRRTVETTRVPRMGVSTNSRTDSIGSRVVALVAGGAFEAAGVHVGDLLISTGGIDQTHDASGEEFRRAYAGRDGEAYEIVVLRDGQRLTLTGHVRMGENTVTRLEFDAGAGVKAARVRSGLLRGGVDR